MGKSVKVSALFFDSAAVLEAMNKKSRQALSRIGAFVRRTAKSSLKYRDGASTPGNPPHVHRGKFTKTTTNKKTGVVKSQAASPLRELWFFGVDLATMSVVAGPVIFRRVNTVAVALEKGGDIPVSIRERGIDGRTIRARRTVRVAARPTAQPAMDANIDKFPAQWSK